MNKLKKIALFEAENSARIIKAGLICQKKQIAQIVFIGNENKIKKKYPKEKFKNIIFIEPKIFNKTPILVQKLYELRKHKGITINDAKNLINDPIYFATMLLKNGDIDGVVGGAETSTTNCLKPAFQIIKSKIKDEIISSFFILKSKDKSFGENGVMIVADCAINILPSATELFQIAKHTYESSKIFLKKPKIAFLSYSTNKSATGEQILKVSDSVELFKNQFPNVCADGEIQVDAALEPIVANKKCPKSELQGKANVLIFPDLQSGNIGYKLMNYCKKLKAIGPICQNIAMPYNDVSRGATVDEIVEIIKITTKQ